MISSGSEVRAHLVAIGCKGQEISQAHLAAIGCNGLRLWNVLELRGFKLQERMLILEYNYTIDKIFQR